MTQNLQHQPHVHTKTNSRYNRPLPNQRRADQMLREIAFVLKMTARVRDEIKTEQESREPVTV